MPYRYVCDAVYDCPYGTDEVQCQNRSCPGNHKLSNLCATSKQILYMLFMYAIKISLPMPSE